MRARQLLQRVGVESINGMVRETDLEDLAHVVDRLERDSRRLQFLCSNWYLLSTSALRKWDAEELRVQIDLHMTAAEVRA